MNAPILVLVVDDEPAVRSLLRQGFEQEGYAVSEAGSKARLLKILEQGPVGLVTLDLELGPENGLELAREIRAKHNVPIMMVTGKSAPEDRLVGLEGGADDYITKPFLGPVPVLVENLRWRYLRLDQQAQTAVRGRRRRQRHDDGYHDRRFAAPARRRLVQQA